MIRRAPGRVQGRVPGQVLGQATTTSLTRSELRAIRARAANRNGPRRLRPLRLLAAALIVGGAAGVACAIVVQVAGIAPPPPGETGPVADLLRLITAEGFLIGSILAASLGASLRTVTKA